MLRLKAGISSLFHLRCRSVPQHALDACRSAGTLLVGPDKLLVRTTGSMLDVVLKIEALTSRDPITHRGGHRQSQNRLTIRGPL
jgi:hypothetical protein